MPDDELDDIDVRTVAILWTNDPGRPELVLNGTTEFEALGLLRAAYLKLELSAVDLVDFEDGDEDDEM